MSDASAEWRWDPTLFEGTASHYLRGRIPYAPGLGEAFTRVLDLDGTGRLLDVGCGPGALTQHLTDRFEESVGVDPDPGMLAEAAQLGLADVRWIELRAEALPAGLGTFRAITFAASFHWMDRPLVARTTRGMLDDEDAAVVQVDLGTTSPAADVVEAVRCRHLGVDRRAGRSVRNTSPSGEEAIFETAGFTRFERHLVPDGRTLVRTVDDLVANAFSSSGTAPHLFADGGAAFEADLRAALLEREPSGRFPVTLGDNVLRVRRI